MLLARKLVAYKNDFAEKLRQAIVDHYDLGSQVSTPEQFAALFNERLYFLLRRDFAGNVDIILDTTKEAKRLWNDAFLPFFAVYRDIVGLVDPSLLNYEFA